MRIQSIDRAERWILRTTLTAAGCLAIGMLTMPFIVRAQAPTPTGSDAPYKRVYHPVSIIALAGGTVRHTHVEVGGFVTYIAHEDDGDLHIRLCTDPKIKVMDRNRCIVAECIPKMPCPAPEMGSRVTVHGISRFDKETNHLWGEVHPIEEGFW